MFMANIIFMVVLVLVVTCYNQTFIINWNSSTNLTLICGTGISTTVVFGSLCSTMIGSGGNGGDGQSSGSGSASQVQQMPLYHHIQIYAVGIHFMAKVIRLLYLEMILIIQS